MAISGATTKHEFIYILPKLSVVNIREWNKFE
jgi:hypothetical protein